MRLTFSLSAVLLASLLVVDNSVTAQATDKEKVMTSKSSRENGSSSAVKRMAQTLTSGLQSS